MPPALLAELEPERFLALVRLLVGEDDGQHFCQGSGAEAIGAERTITAEHQQRMSLVVEPADERLILGSGQVSTFHVAEKNDVEVLQTVCGEKLGARPCVGAL